MSVYLHVLRTGIVAVALLMAIGAHAGARTQSVTAEETGVAHLAGYSFEGRLKTDAEMAVKRAPGIAEVANSIEVLPASQNDDRIRWATFYRVYTDDFLSRYAPGGVYQVLREVREDRRFPGMQPAGRYPIHIVVKNGRTLLLGVVDNAADRQIAEVRAREVSGVFELENGLVVAR
jgi:hyperosmotically inducible periplasmic protein